jgi:non-heme chloroperoxidase
MRGAISKFFKTSDGVRLHYLEAGTGRAIVFVPGWTTPAQIWALQMQHFSERYKLVLLDPRSQGESEKTNCGNCLERRAQDLAELLAHLEQGPVVLVGWSMGAAEILSCVGQFGTAGMSGLVLVDTFFVQPDWLKDEVLQMSYDLKNDRVRTTEQYIRAMYKKPQSDNYIATLVEASLRTPTDAAVALMESFLKQVDWRPALAKVDKPLLYVAQEGLRDEAQLLKRNLPWAEIEIFEAAGHALFIDEADRFNSILERFIANRCN